MEGATREEEEMDGGKGKSEPGEGGGRKAGPGRRALILGGSGLIGAALARALSRDPGWTQIHLLLRRDPPPSLRLPRVEWTVSPPEDWAQDDTFRDVDTVFITLGTTRRAAGSARAFRAVDLDLVVATARAAESGGVRQLQVVSSTGANPASRFLYPRTKGEMEREVSLLHIPSIVLLRPSLLLGDREEPRPGEEFASVLLRPLAPLLRGPLSPLRPIEAATVAAAMAELARAPEPGIAVLESDRIRRRGRQGSSSSRD